MLAKSPIGIFDSGLGGLTVLKSLEKLLPNESFIYFGDTAHLPYGNKGNNTIIKYSSLIVDFFLKHKVKSVIIACNTASAIAYKKLKSIYKIPIFDVVNPSVIYSNSISKSRNIGIIGTYSTINSNAYKIAFNKINSDCFITEIACPLFVPLIEEGWHNSKIAQEITKIYLNKINNNKLDTLILGCTHYPIMSSTIKKFLNNNVELVYSGETVGNDLLNFYKKNNLENNNNNKIPTKFFVTDFPQKFDELGGRFLGKKLINVKQVSLF